MNVMHQNIGSKKIVSCEVLTKLAIFTVTEYICFIFQAKNKTSVTVINTALNLILIKV